jgi:hypothetical protein
MIKIRDKCLICNTSTDIIEGPMNDYIDINCPRCGKYRTSDWGFHSSEFYKHPDKIPALSHWIRKNQKKNEILKLDTDLINYILDNFSLPSHNEQADNLLLYFGNESKYPGATVDSNLFGLIPLIGAYDEISLKFVIDHLKSLNLIVMENPTTDNPLREKIFENFAAYLTFKGWEKFSELNKPVNSGHIAFMAMQYGETDLEKIYHEYLKPSLKQTGYELRKLEEQLKAGLIDDQLRVEIRRSRFVIVDLTHGNQGAYWEAGYAEGLGKPVIYLCQKKVFDEKKTHFDTNHLTTVPWELDTIVSDMQKLKTTIRATLPLEAAMEDI